MDMQNQQVQSFHYRFPYFVNILIIILIKHIIQYTSFVHIMVLMYYFYIIVVIKHIECVHKMKNSSKLFQIMLAFQSRIHKK